MRERERGKEQFVKICKLSKHCVTFTFTYSSTKTATLVREGTLRHNLLVPLSGSMDRFGNIYWPD